MHKLSTIAATHRPGLASAVPVLLYHKRCAYMQQKARATPERIERNREMGDHILCGRVGVTGEWTRLRACVRLTAPPLSHKSATRLRAWKCVTLRAQEEDVIATCPSQGFIQAVECDCSKLSVLVRFEFRLVSLPQLQGPHHHIAPPRHLTSR